MDGGGDADLRLRAAWLYHAHGLTQQAVAGRLGVSRSKVLRLLEEVRARQEVRISITGGPASATARAVALEDGLGIARVVVVPGDAPPEAGGTAAVGMALGHELGRLIRGDMLVGVGWGRTLQAALPAFSPRRQPGCRVVSMIGGSAHPDLAGAFEFPWRLAGRLGAECQLLPAPVVVATPEVRRSLLDDSGMGRVLALGAGLDLAVYSVGDVGQGGTSLARRLLPEAAHDEMVARGAVGEVLCRCLDAHGREVPHEIGARLMSLPLGDLSRARARVLAAAGAARAPAILAAVRRTRPTLLVIDEPAARALRPLAEGPPRGG